MLKERRLAAETVATALFAAEKAIDDAISRTAALAALMPSTRADAHLSALIGQDALVAAIETMRSLGQARQNIVDTHKGLSIAQRDIGLGAVSFGGGGEKPPPPADTRGHLQAVTEVRSVA